MLKKVLRKICFVNITLYFRQFRRWDLVTMPPPLPPLCPDANVGVTCRQPTTIPARRLGPGSYATYLRQRERLRRKPIQYNYKLNFQVMKFIVPFLRIQNDRKNKTETFLSRRVRYFKIQGKTFFSLDIKLKEPTTPIEFVNYEISL